MIDSLITALNGRKVAVSFAASRFQYWVIFLGYTAAMVLQYRYFAQARIIWAYQFIDLILLKCS